MSHIEDFRIPENSNHRQQGCFRDVGKFRKFEPETMMGDSSEIRRINMELYNQLISEVLKTVPAHIESRFLAKKHSYGLKKRRIIEKIGSLRKLIEEMENQLVVDPETGDIDQVINMATQIQTERPEITESLQRYEANVRRQRLQVSRAYPRQSSAPPSSSTQHGAAPSSPLVAPHYSRAHSTGSTRLASARPGQSAGNSAWGRTPAVSHPAVHGGQPPPPATSTPPHSTSLLVPPGGGQQGPAPSFGAFARPTSTGGAAASSRYLHLPLTSHPMTIPASGTATARSRRLSTPTTPGTPTTPTWSSSSMLLQQQGVSSPLSPLPSSSPTSRTLASPLASPSRTSAGQARSIQKEVPERVVDLIASTFDSVGGGDWKQFVEGLGHGLNDDIRISRGEAERMERDYSCLSTRLKHIFKRFQDKCLRSGVSTNIIEIIVDTLKNENVWGEPVYNRLAREVQEATGLAPRAH